MIVKEARILEPSYPCSSPSQSTHFGPRRRHSDLMDAPHPVAASPIWAWRWDLFTRNPTAPVTTNDEATTRSQPQSHDCCSLPAPHPQCMSTSFFSAHFLRTACCTIPVRLAMSRRQSGTAATYALGERREKRKCNTLISGSWHHAATTFLYAAICFVVLLQARLVEGCSSRSTPKPKPPSPTMRPNITIQTFTCPVEYDTHYCLNGATCFTVKIAESLLYNCECADGYMGQRCEFKDLDGSYLPSKQRALLEQAGITSGVLILVIFLVLLLTSLYLRARGKQSTKHATSSVDETDRRDALHAHKVTTHATLIKRPFSA